MPPALPLVALVQRGSLSVARICLPLALPNTGPLAALLQRRSLPLSSENLPASCPAYHRASCRATTEAKPASQ